MATPIITPHLWYTSDLSGAIDFYCAVFPDSVIHNRVEHPGGVAFVEFTLGGQRLMAVQAPHDVEFNDRFSFFVDCVDQAEVDHYWDALLAGGGAPQQCGWLIDRYGMRWQIVPQRLGELIGDPDPQRSAAAYEAMMGMVKLDVAELERAVAAVPAG